ncbi:Uncharacterised protein [Sphingobacterium daejeonense]|nr:Uncharacterised protein [Sphingobacterium daejeonense]
MSLEFRFSSKIEFSFIYFSLSKFIMINYFLASNYTVFYPSVSAIFAHFVGKNIPSKDS